MRRAFTLIELLVAIAVIAILTALLLPVYSRTREKGRHTHCVNNLRQIGVALEAYRTDWGDQYPRAHSYFSPAWFSVTNVLGRYVSSPQVWICPSDTGDMFPHDPSFERHPPGPYWRSGSTSYEYYCIQTLLAPPVPSMWRIIIVDASKVHICCEAEPWHYHKTADDRILIDSPLPLNVLYCDGHVAAKSWKQQETEMMAGTRKVGQW